MKRTLVIVLSLCSATAVAQESPYKGLGAESVSPEVVAIVDAMGVLLGTGPGLAPQAVEGLDNQGNRNGRLDVGDLLAYLDRNRATLSPDMLRKLLAAANAAANGAAQTSVTVTR